MRTLRKVSAFFFNVEVQVIKLTRNCIQSRNELDRNCQIRLFQTRNELELGFILSKCGKENKSKTSMRVKLIGEFRKDRHFLLKVDDSIEETHYLGMDTTKMSECNMNMNMNSIMHDVCMLCYVYADKTDTRQNW